MQRRVTSARRTHEGGGQAALVAALQAAAQGDRESLKLVFDRTSAKLMGICLRILKDREEAEDALQDVFVSIWNRAGSFDPARASAVTWLAAIARNRAIDRLRARRPREARAPIDEALNLADSSPDGFAQLAAGQEVSQLHGCMSELEGRTQSAIRAAFFDGFAYSQLAERAGVPLGTMKSWIRRGLQQLRGCLER